MRRHQTFACVTALAALVVADKPALALNITPSYDISITSSPNATAIEGAINAAVSTVEGLYSNNVTIPIQFYYDNIEQSQSSFALESSNGGGAPYTPSYANYTAALTADSLANPSNTVLSTAVASLSKGNDANGAQGMAIPYSQQLMLQSYGLPSQTAPTPSFPAFVNINAYYDTTSTPFSYSSTVPSGQYDATGGIEHEINEVLGGGGGGSVLNALYDDTNPSPGATQPCASGSFTYACNHYGGLDLYRYSAPNTPSFTTSGTATSYFSFDGGKTNIIGFEQNSTASLSKWASRGDYGDFVPDGTGNGQLIQDAFNVTGKYENYTNASPETAMMQALGWDPTHPCNVECYNTFASSAKKAARSFSIVLAGNVTAQINTAETGIDTLVNPFAYVNQVFFGGTGTSSATVTFNGTNTVITYTGTNPILPGYTYSYGSNPHFGFEGTEAIAPPSIGTPPTEPIDLLGEYWDYTDDTQDQEPTLGINCRSGGSGSEYLIFFSDVTLGGVTTGEWNECQGTGVTLTNPTDSDETLSDAGYYLSDTSIPLDSLNFGDFPPPDQPGSVFTDMGGLDGSVLSAGASEGVDVPEPSSMALFAAGIAGLLVRRRR